MFGLTEVGLGVGLGVVLGMEVGVGPAVTACTKDVFSSVPTDCSLQVTVIVNLKLESKQQALLRCEHIIPSFSTIMQAGHGQRLWGPASRHLP